MKLSNEDISKILEIVKKIKDFACCATDEEVFCEGSKFEANNKTKKNEKIGKGISSSNYYRLVKITKTPKKMKKSTLDLYKRLEMFIEVLIDTKSDLRDELIEYKTFFNVQKNKFYNAKMEKDLKLFLHSDPQIIKDDTEIEYFKDPISLGFRIGFSYIILDSIDCKFEYIDSYFHKLVREIYLISSLNLKISLIHFNINKSKYSNLVNKSFMESLPLPYSVDSDLFNDPYLVLGQEFGFNIGQHVYATLFFFPNSNHDNKEDHEIKLKSNGMSNNMDPKTQLVFRREKYPAELNYKSDMRKTYFEIIKHLFNEPNETFFSASIKRIKQNLKFYPYLE